MRKTILALAGALGLCAVSVPSFMTRGSKIELVQAKFSNHPATHTIPINVSPLGTNALFIGKGDGEGVSMKAQKQQLSLVQKGEKAMEANMNAGDCKAWGNHMARRRALHLTDKVGTPEDRRIAMHCGKLFAAQMHSSKVDIAIARRHAKARKAAKAAKANAAPIAAASAPQPAAAAIAAVAVAVPMQKKAAMQKKAVMQAKKAAAGPWWKESHYGFKKGLHMKRPLKHVMPLFNPKAAQKAKDMAYFKKTGLI